MNIVGRNAEQEIISHLLSSKKAEFLALYGRRRVGKTYLIRRMCKDQMVFDFTGAHQLNLPGQLSNFFQVYLERTRGTMQTGVPTSWSMAFQYLKDYLTQFKSRKKIVVFLDEMPWMDSPRSGFLSALEFFWNQHGSKMDNLLLVGCGSAASWIHKKILGAKGGLHNRVTKRIHLRPFTLSETEVFCKGQGITLTQYQIILLYMVMGGIPFYWEELKKGLSAIQQIDEICFKPSGLLYSEFEYLLDSLFDNGSYHRAIVEALSSKPNGMLREELLALSKVPEGGSIQRTLEELEMSGFITRIYPFSNKKKESLYKLSDFYCLFYLKFIAPAKSAKQGSWQAISNTARFKAWSGYAFENICFQHLDQIKSALGISGVVTEVSGWKFRGNDESPGAQIDLIINRKDDVINLCEAKFTDKEFLMTKSYAQQLRTRKSIFQYASKTKKALHTTLITTYPPIRNLYFKSEVDSMITMESLFE